MLDGRYVKVGVTCTLRGEDDECTSHKEIYKKPHRYEQVSLDTYGSPGTLHYNIHSYLHIYVRLCLYYGMYVSIYTCKHCFNAINKPQ